MNKMLFFLLYLFVFPAFASVSIDVKYRSRPFYFRFPPKLKNIKGKVVMAKAVYEHPDLGKCTYEMVKDLNNEIFYGWCKCKKIKGYPKIFEFDKTFKKLSVGEDKVELGFNEFASQMIEKMNQEHENRKK